MSLNTECDTGRHISAPIKDDRSQSAPSAGGRRSRLTLAVSLRHQSADDQRKFVAAAELFISEIVRSNLNERRES